MSTATHREFARQPALDGVRGISVALVLLFHQGWLSGGYVGVSVFFTLSGYLITSLAIIEHDRTGRLDVRAFYGRRIRRLLPASLVCLLGVVLLALTGVFDVVDHLRRELWGALAQVYNWVALADGRSYAEMVTGDDTALRSPLDHYWSLAIEEQFYWAWPLVLVVILRRPARGRTTLIAALTLAFAASAPLIAAVWGAEAAYWATPARLAEILIGALLAAVLQARRGRRLPRAIGVLGPLGLGAIVVTAIVWPSGSGPAYRGWLPVFALASVALILGLQVPSGLRRVLACRPLVVLGAISYGVYLFHWPVFVVLDEARTNLPTVPLFVLRLVLTGALAVVSFRYLESPVRRARPRRLVVPVAAAAACSLLAIAVVVVPGGSTPYWMTAAAAEPRPSAPVDTAPLVPSATPAETTEPEPTTAASSPTTTESTPTTRVPSTTTSPTTSSTTTPVVEPSVLAASGTQPETTPPAPTAPPAPVAPPLPAPPARPVRALVVGDSTSMATAKGLEAWEDIRPGYVDFTSLGAPGCGFLTGGPPRQFIDGSFVERCEEHRRMVTGNLSWLRPDVVVGLVTLADIDDRTWDDPDGYVGPADQPFFDRLVADYDAATVEFLVAGATDVLWIAPPVPVVAYGPAEEYLLDPARYVAYADALREVAARHPGQVEVVDLAGWVAAQPVPPERPDGLHWSTGAATEIAEQFLGPIIVTAALT